MAWPQATEYGEALQNLSTTCRDPDLRVGHVATNAAGLPLPHTGNFAAVFEVRSPSERQSWAAKCFTRNVPDLQARYAQIDAHLRQHRLPFMVHFRYLPEILLVRGQWYPVLRMDWVNGLCLDEFLADCLRQTNYKSTLNLLCEMWLKLARLLREAEVAHGDLQHGNVMLIPVPDKEAYNLRLIDYDGLYVPALAATPPEEVGHPAYQHPQRQREGTYGPEIDRFAHLVIYTTLRCLLAGGRELWERYYNGDQLLLGPHDLAHPEHSAAFRELWQLPDDAARNLVGHLALAARGTLADVPLLENVVRNSEVAILEPDRERQVNQWLGTARTRRDPLAPAPAGSAPGLIPLPEQGSPVVVTCQCGQRFLAAAHVRGTRLPCPVCAHLIEVPATALQPLSGVSQWQTPKRFPSKGIAAASRTIGGRVSAATKAFRNAEDLLRGAGDALGAIVAAVLSVIIVVALVMAIKNRTSGPDLITDGGDREAIEAEPRSSRVPEQSDTEEAPADPAIPQPTATPLDKVNRLIAESNRAFKTAEQAATAAADEYRKLFGEENLAGFPKNRPQIEDSARRTASLFAIAAEQMRLAAAKDEEAAQQSSNPLTGDFLTLKARSLRALADAHDARQKAAQLLGDETIPDASVLTARVAPLAEQARQLQAESTALDRQADKIYRDIQDPFR